MLYWSKYVTEGARRDPARSGFGLEVPKFFLRLQEHQQLTSIEQLGLDCDIPDLEATVVEYFRQNHSVFYDFSSSNTNVSRFLNHSPPCNLHFHHFKMKQPFTMCVELPVNNNSREKVLVPTGYG